MQRRASVLLSNEIASPMAMGFAPPAVLLPQSLPDDLQQTDLEHVLVQQLSPLHTAASMLGRLNEKKSLIYFASGLSLWTLAADTGGKALLDNLDNNDLTELTIAMEINYFQLNRAEYFVPVAVTIPGRELALARRGGAERTLIDFIGEVKDEFGTTLSNVRDKVDIKLSGTTAAELARRPIQYDTGFTPLPGNYKIKMLARDAETGRIGTYQASFTIPNLNKEEKRIPISSVVLSSQRVDLREALFKREQG
jgi:hypothetical protein